MTADRKTAAITGVLFILATVLGVTNALTLGPIIGVPDYLGAMSQNSGIVRLATLLNILMAGAVVAIAVALYPILKRSSQTLATGYLAARIIEGVILAITGIAWLSLTSLGVEFVGAGQPAGDHYQTLGDLLVSGSTVMFTLGAEITFGVTALILNYTLIKTRLVPRLISMWGFVAGALLLIKGAMVILGMPVSAIEIAFTAPIALNEMVLAVWLIVKGFSAPVKVNKPH